MKKRYQQGKTLKQADSSRSCLCCIFIKDDNLGRTGKLIRHAVKRFLCHVQMLPLRVDLGNDLAFVNPGCGADRLAEREGHAGAHAVCSGARGKRILPKNVMGIHAEQVSVICLANRRFQKLIRRHPRCLDAVMPQLEALAGLELKSDRKMPAAIAHVISGDLDRGSSADKGFRTVLGLARVGPFEAAVRNTLS